MKLSDFYYYDKEKIIEVIQKQNPKTILIQLPEGLKHFFPSLLKEIREIIPERINVVLDGSPTWGSCLIDLDITSEFDLVLHFGHIEYPYWRTPPNVVLVDLKSKNAVTEKTIKRLVQYLKSRSFSKVGVYGTAQHDVKPIANYLSNNGMEVLNNLGLSTVLGCWYSDLERIKGEIDAVIMVSGGFFHSLGAGLLLNGQTPVINLDPYTDSFRDVTSDILRLIKVRYFKIYEAAGKQNWVIIAGKAGQYRPHIITNLKRLLIDKGKNYYEVRTAYLSSESISNIDNGDAEVFVITSCPRLPIDNFNDYFKPVLTPGEARMALTSPAGRYIFPW